MRVAVLFLALAGAAVAEPSLEERVRSLETRVGAAEPAKTASSAGAPVDVSFKDGLVFKSAGGEIDAHIGGTLVVYGRFYIKNNESISSDSFSIRQARVVLEGRLFKDWEFRVQPTATNGGNFVIDDGFVGFARWHYLRIRAGQFKAPFGLEQLQLDPYTDFPERALADRMIPAREIGIMVHGEPVEKVLSYQLMISNGTGRSSDENSDKDLTGRVWLRPMATGDSFWLKGLHLGVAGTWGRQDRGPGVLPYTYSTGLTLTTFATASPSAPSVKFDGHRDRLGLEFAWLVGRFKLQSEAIFARDRYTVTGPDDEHGRSTHKAGYVFASLFLTDDVQSWDRVRPKHPFLVDGGIGAISVAFRYSWFRIGDEIFDDGVLNRNISARRADESTLGVNWYPNGNIRINLAYVWVSYHGENVRPVVVRGKAIDDEDLLILRAQVDF